MRTSERIWLTDRVKKLLPEHTLKACRNDEWQWVGIYFDGIYCGGFGLNSSFWTRVEVPVSLGRRSIPCPANLRQQVRAAVNQAIAELAEQQVAA